VRRRLAAAVFPIALLFCWTSTDVASGFSRTSSVLVASGFSRTSSAGLAADALRARVRQLLSDPALSAGTWGLEVRSLSRGETLVDVDAHRLLTPASTLKTVTLAAAAERLGWDFTFVTRVVSDAPIVDGVLQGDLVIVGDGDPSLDDWDGQATTLFASWAAHLKNLGIRTIAGRVIGDDRAFGDEGLGSGWAWDDLAFSYSAPASGLQFNDGAAQLVIEAGVSSGSPAIVSFRPPYANVRVDSRVLTSPSGTPRSIALQPSPRAPGFVVDGAIPPDDRYVRTVAVDNPTVYFVRAVRAALVANGIDVRGDAVDVGELPAPPAVEGASVLMEHRSPPLSSLAEPLLQLSQNMFAESLLRTLGRKASGAGTAETGRKALREVLDAWNVPAAETLVVDGSGLSRYNLVTADALTSVLEHVYRDARLRGPYLAALPVGARSGTLANRMTRTAAEGRVRAKTGSFSNARSIAGFVDTADGEPLAFAIIANNYGVPPEAVDRVVDSILVALAGFRREP
jgi:D-alanyl-D-alanine carboxypeptidase/D-alanyl-D-alanine-endopeptidase (penicillin-binding protein 4)